MEEESITSQPEVSSDAEGLPTDHIGTLRSENETLKNLIRVRDARDEITGRLASAGARSPALLFAYAVDKLQFDAEGTLQNADAVVDHLLKSFPEQFGKEVPVSINGGSGIYGRTAPLTKETLARMSPAEIAKLEWSEVREALSRK